MSRAPRLKVTYDHAHSSMTATRLRKPMRKTMWTNEPDEPREEPAELGRRRSVATAAARPIVASEPLSR